MKVKDLIEELPERQKKSVMRCMETCSLVDPEEEIPISVSKDLVEFVRAISNPIRLSILRMLRDRWLCVCLISRALGEDQTLISHHLRILKGLNLLHERKEGKLRFYRTNKEVLGDYLTRLSLELLGSGQDEGSEES